MSSHWSQDCYIKAYKFAAQAHQGQKYPGTDLPYIMHLSFVCMEVIAALNVESDRDGNLVIQCALLHDAIEDTDITFDRLEAEFGKAVANGVLALTKDVNLEKHLQIEDSLKRIEQQPAEIWMVKLADRIANLQVPPPYWTKDKIKSYRQEAIYIYDALKDASKFLGDRLYKKIEEYRVYLL
jgi:(p)ppGpp synthase/HD superfamily hydrolase